MPYVFPHLDLVLVDCGQGSLHLATARRGGVLDELGMDDAGLMRAVPLRDVRLRDCGGCGNEVCHQCDGLAGTLLEDPAGRA